jgi:hypothetical protein
MTTLIHHQYPFIVTLPVTIESQVKNPRLSQICFFTCGTGDIPSQLLKGMTPAILPISCIVSFLFSPELFHPRYKHVVNSTFLNIYPPALLFCQVFLHFFPPFWRTISQKCWLCWWFPMLVFLVFWEPTFYFTVSCILVSLDGWSSLQSFNPQVSALVLLFCQL